MATIQKLDNFIDGQVLTAQELNDVAKQVDLNKGNIVTNTNNINTVSTNLSKTVYYIKKTINIPTESSWSLMEHPSDPFDALMLSEGYKYQNKVHFAPEAVTADSDYSAIPLILPAGLQNASDQGINVSNLTRFSGRRRSFYLYSKGQPSLTVYGVILIKHGTEIGVV